VIKINNNNLGNYSIEYTEDNFWGKIKKVAAKVGVKTIYAALLLYYTLQLPTVPAWAKTVIVGSLGYFIFPFDAIPDVVPAVGHADDLGVLAIALSSVAIHINESIKAKARQKIRDLLGSTVKMDALLDVEKNFPATISSTQIDANT
jgi:uncharacterized membrane protein YkvA (DUF1232 family)